MRQRWIAIAMTLAVIAVYAARLDDIAGLYKDDAYYLVLAQALAQGHGYALVSSATAPLLPGFPPGFPLLLAPVFAAVPNYPDNLVWLKVVSIVAMLGTGLLTFRYWHGCREIGQGQAAAIALLTTLTPGLVFLATSTVMSEGVFTFALMGSAIALERAARVPAASQSRRVVVLAALVTTAAWLIRGAGVALVAGGVVWLCWRRGWRVAAGFLVVCAISYAPWAAYSAMHRPTVAERAAHGGDVVRAFRPPVAIGYFALGERAAANAVNVFGRHLGALVFPAGYRGADESGLEALALTGGAGPRAGSMGMGAPLVAASGAFAAIAILGTIAMARRRSGVAELFCALTIGMLLLATTVAAYRYLLPLAPFVIGYFLVGVATVATRVRAGMGPASFRIAAACLLLLLVAEHGQYVWLKTQGPSPAWLRDGHEVRLVTDYVKTHLPADAKIVSTNPGLVYLLTGRRAVVYDNPLANRRRWQAEGFRYAVALHAVPGPSQSRDGLLFESPRLRLWVTELGPPPAE